MSLLASTVLQPSNGAYNYIQFHYDQTAPADAPGIVGHDPNYSTGYNIRGNPTQISKSANNVWLNTVLSYDIAGNIKSVTDQNGHTATFNFNDGSTFAHPVQQTNAAGQTTSFQYDYGTGKLTATTDPNGVTTRYSYAEALDRLIQVVAAAGTSAETQTSYSYSNRTQVSQYRDQNSPGDRALRSDTIYDALGRLSENRTYENASIETAYITVLYGYDALGRVTTISSPTRFGDLPARTTTYSYDNLGRTTRVQTPDASVATASYSGNQTTTTDPAGNVKVTTTDALGRITRVVEDPNGLNYVTNYSYDPLDNLIQVTQGQQTRQFVYNTLGWLMQSTQPEPGATNYAYDGVGNVTQKIDARGIATGYAYDALDRLTQKSYSDGTPTVSYSYDAASAYPVGRLKQVSNANSTTSYTGYDALGRVTATNQVTAGQTYSFGYSYNRAGALVSETYPSGRMVAMSYDSANRMTAVTGTFNGQQTPYVSGVTYAAHGEPSFFTYGNQLARTLGYNSRLQLSSYQDALQNLPNNILFSVSANWGAANNNGNLQGETLYEGGPGALNSLTQLNRSYSYDAVSRLLSASDSSGWSRTLCYDRNGNMWVTGNSGVTLAGNTPQDLGGPCPSATTPYNGNNQINGANYDAAGNQTVVNGDTLAYDGENRVTSALDGVMHTTESYLYDGDGQRVEKSGPAGTTVYIYDAQGRLAAESSTASNISPCTTCYLSSDQLGSTRLVTDASGNVVARYDYLPFGEEVAPNATDNISQKFTGQERDSETGMDFFHARYFGAALGRFTSPDPANAGADIANPQSWNAYAYVLGNPLDS